VLAHRRGVEGTVGVGARTNTELVVADELHPLGDVEIRAGHVGGDVTTDGVTIAVGTVGVELTTHVAIGDVDLGEVTIAHDLDVHVGLEEGDTGEGTVRDDTSIVTGLGAPSDLDGLGVGNVLEGRGSEDAEVLKIAQTY
jgi:hypothetical protein